jgi:hypothetical protein
LRANRHLFDDATSLLRQANDWYQRSGAGDGALLATFLLTAITTAAQAQADPRPLHLVLDEARRVHNDEVETLALDSLALLAARNDDLDLARQLLAATGGQLKTTGPAGMDRFDADLARQLIDTATESLTSASPR